MMAQQLSDGFWFSQLLAGIDELPAGWDRQISALALHSGQVIPGGCFLAFRGARRDGRDYIADALSRGAVAVIAEGEAGGVELVRGTPIIKITRLRERVSEFAARFYGQPTQDLRVIGITGTNGKTTVASMVAQALNDEPRYGPCGLSGTLGTGRPGNLQPSSNTTPDPVAVQQFMAELRDDRARSAVLEVSSHALVQHRVAAVQFDTAVFTNLGRDHLDYHQTLTAYQSAKKQLFRFPGLRNAVVNADDKLGREIMAESGNAQVTAYSLRADVQRNTAPRWCIARDIHADLDGLRMNVETSGGRTALDSPLIGRVNAANLLASFATLTALGMEPEPVAAVLARVTPATGRMQRFGGAGELPLVVVDYAHTPDALQLVLKDLRILCRGALWCVFGCGGDRDTGKRPLMGEVAGALADRVVLTSDNPRSESPESILDDILAGIAERSNVALQVDRSTAVAGAIAEASSKDIVLIAGKGHETFQEIKGRRLPVSDQLLVRNALQDRPQ